MAQIKIRCRVTHGSQVVTIDGPNIAYQILKNAIFMVASELVPYTIAEDATYDGTAVTFNLTGNYVGNDNAACDAVIASGFTVPDNIPTLAQGDIGTAAIFTKAMYRIQDMVTSVTPDGWGQFVDAIDEAKTAANVATAAQIAVDDSVAIAQNAAVTATTAATAAETKADEAQTAAAAAAASEVAAETKAQEADNSATSAHDSATTATSKAQEASDSATAAATSATTATTKAQDAADSAASILGSVSLTAAEAQAASNSAAEAATSATIATDEAQAASNSAASASASAASASASASVATDKAAAANSSANAAATSATNAATSATNAATSATNAANSATTASAQANEAAASATAAFNSATTATTKADEASASATSAAGNATTATTKADESATSAATAQDWAIKTTGPVANGEYSAKYWANQASSIMVGTLVYMGAWDASGGTFPPSPKKGHFYKVSVGGSIDGTQFDAADDLIYNGSSWDKIDNTESVVGSIVTSVAGRSGDVTLTTSDIGGLTTALADKSDITHDHSGMYEPVILASTTTKYWRGDKTWQTLDGAVVGLGSVENTALSTWAGSANLATLGTITTGVWSGTPIADAKITPTLTGKTYNGLTLTSTATGWTIAGGTASKTLTLNNTLTFAGTDESVLNIGTGGTLGTAAFTDSGAFQAASSNLTAWATLTPTQKQDVLVSGENIKTMNGQSLLGSGNVRVTTWANPTIVMGATQDAVAWGRYLLTGPQAAVALPASPSVGDRVMVTVINGLLTNSMVRNNNNIMGLAEDYTLSLGNNLTYEFEYIDAVRGWWQI